MEDLKEYASAAAKEISELPTQGQKHFMAALASHLGNDDDAIMELIEAMIAKTKRYEKITRWMTTRFQKDMTLTPKCVAAECVYYLKVNSKMMPFLIATGRKVKDRLRHQRSYAAHKGSASE